MKKPLLISFDCAETLIWARWNPVELAVTSAIEAGVNLDVEQASGAYERIIRSRWQEYLEANLGGTAESTDAFWNSVGEQWLGELGIATSAVELVRERAMQKLYGPEPSVFGLFDDTVACLEAIKSRGVSMAVTSNWDATLERTLEAFGLRQYFGIVVASMVVGAEKPAPLIFETMLSDAGAQASDTWHVGDDPIADSQGSRALGMTAFTLDRANKHDSPFVISTLLELVEKYDSCD